MQRSLYANTIDAELGPRLNELGFTVTNLTGCMRPEVLYRRGDLWFGTSWDWRDRYLEVSLGSLVWFKDVMPRVVVVGRYESYCSALRSLNLGTGDPGKAVAALVSATIEEAIAAMDAHPEAAVSERARLAGHILGPALDAELSWYGA